MCINISKIRSNIKKMKGDDSIMYRNNTKNITFGMLALVVSVVAIGLAYAGFTGTLNINGTGNVMSAKWDIYFNNLSNAVTTGTANVVTPATISPKTKIGDYYVELASPGDSVTYTFDVVNDGNFDAVLTTLTKSTPTCTPSATLCNYLIYTLKYTSNNRDVAENDKLLVGETKNMTLKLELDSNMPASALSNTELSVGDLGITLLYSQDSAFGGNPVVSSKCETIGDEVTFGSEHFYVVSCEEEGDTVLLAKYNLLVGDVYDVTWDGGDYPSTYALNKSMTSSNTVGYGLQNSIAKGFMYQSNQSQVIGVVPFAGLGYWDDAELACNGTGCDPTTQSRGLKSAYANSSNPAGTTSYQPKPYPYVYNSSMSTIAPSIVYGESGTYDGSRDAQNNGYTIAYFVEQYVNELKTHQNAPASIEGRLLTYEEAVSAQVTYTVEDQSACTTYFTNIVGNAETAAALCSDSTYKFMDTDTLADIIGLGFPSSNDYASAGLSNVNIERSAAGDHLLDSSFWLGSAGSRFHVFAVVGDDDVYDGYDFWISLSFGLRPVITVSTSDI